MKQTNFITPNSLRSTKLSQQDEKLTSRQSGGLRPENGL
jgi:hypothetical protein